MQYRPRSLGIEDELRKRLKDSGASQPEISEDTGVPQSTVSRFLRGSVTPSMRTYEALLKFVLKRDAMTAAGIPALRRMGRKATRGLRG